MGGGHRITKVPGKPDLIENVMSSVTLIIAGKTNILVDTGAVGQDREIIKKLGEHGLKPDDIAIVINTHYHFDHISNNYLFTKAKKIVSHYEWFPDGSCVNWQVNDRIIYEREIVPGVSLILTKGHAFDHISVVVKSDKTIVVAGDAIREKFLDGAPIPIHYHMREEFIESMKKILKVADEIIPGHGRILTKEMVLVYRKKWGV